jgi:predicted alpha/beta superfamily hydrolase
VQRNLRVKKEHSAERKLISNGQGTDAWYKKSVRDLMPGSNTTFAKNQKAGEADNFLKFIQYELFPAVNENYRTYPDSSAISGTSPGGLLNTQGLKAVLLRFICLLLLVGVTYNKL